MPEIIVALSYHCSAGCDQRFFLNKEDVRHNNSSLTPDEDLGNGADCPMCGEKLDYLSEVELELRKIVRYAEQESV